MKLNCTWKMAPSEAMAKRKMKVMGIALVDHSESMKEVMMVRCWTVG